MLRVDFKEIAPMTEKELKNTKSQILSFLKDVHIVGISDYAKGYLPDELICFVIQEAGQFQKIKSCYVGLDLTMDFRFLQTNISTCFSFFWAK